MRGCIGTLAPKPLITSIGEYALISALRDRRFRPVHVSEVPHLRVGVSLLVRYEPCEHCHDWVVGVHGIIIRWTEDDHPGGGGGGLVGRGLVGGGGSPTEYSATYLPEVASDQGWDQKTAVESLVRKAGYRGRITKALLGKIECTRYQSSKRRVTFDEYARGKGLDGGDQDEALTRLLAAAAVSDGEDGNSADPNCGRRRSSSGNTPPRGSSSSGCIIS